ncbi:flagellar hook-basal body complex protein FliE [Polynucleobacter sp. CS-Odin-A6]|jgi:flagellar hook-basal body complex protein FliE|uniref:flagellar hook-basal body complex protein FliE n=1 Tax=Polynucleobacter sp. CS-Odin-A6 TaxID=2689106 RepID=UPI001C0BD309|nr:flagellar hook-basal body complex protein FliE [Polynucleobacter sp. CS-Odin-A6]MBU3621842.1 flagellar hook-basal body complex protein FliE [Polynucleobacter sp. CS-Odin-A6]
MSVGAIDSGRIQAMLAQLKAASAAAPSLAGPINGLEGIKGITDGKGTKSSPSIDFAAALKASLDQVNETHDKAVELGKNFSLGDDSVHLSDVMIATQKASLSFQATVQVRNKLVTAYHDIMNMQV